jgi:hypothetical protein
MFRSSTRFASLCALAALAACATTTSEEKVTTRSSDEGKRATAAAYDSQDAMPWTEEEMKAFEAAATPGPMHARLAEEVGTWDGKCTMWMAPNTPPMTSDCTWVVSMEFDGRFAKCEMSGEMPGMGTCTGVGYYGYDNVARKHVATWMSNHGTGIMNGTGELSADGKTTTWKYTYNCPMTQKPTVMREIERRTGPGSKTYETYMTDPKTGVEFKAMQVALTRRSAP